MKLLEFKDHHLPFAKKMFEARGMSLKPLRELPKCGLIALDNSESNPIAMGFIRLIEGEYGMIDSYLSNPHQLPMLRNHALDEITKELIRKARVMNLLKLFAFSDIGTILTRSYNHGFEKVPGNFVELLLHASGETSWAS